MALIRDVVGRLVQEELQQMIADRRFSPAEEERLRSRAMALGVQQLSFGPDGDALLQHLRRLWELENGNLPTEPASITLQRGEICHAVVPAR